MTRSRSHAPSRFFVVRTPLLPFSDLTELTKARHFDTTCAGTVQHLRQLVTRADVREALFVASPSFEHAVSVWLDTPNASRAEGVVDVLYRFVARMAGRATPFGLFSGWSLGAIGGRETRLALAPRDAYRRTTRLDMIHLLALGEQLASALGHAVTYRPTSGILRAGDRLHYAIASGDDRERAYELVAAERSTFLDAALERAAAGARADEIASAVQAQGASEEDSRSFVESLVEAQLLVADLGPRLTGSPALEGMLDELATLGKAAAREREVLADVSKALARLDAGGLGQPRSAYEEVGRSLGGASLAADVTNLVQVDLRKPAPELVLGDAALRLVEEAIDLVVRVAPPADESAIARFRTTFVERFGDRAVPLTHALDEELGIGFLANGIEPSALLDGFDWLRAEATRPALLGPREEHLLRRVIEASRSGAQTWELDAEDLERLGAGGPASLPDAFELAGSLMASSSDALDRGDGRIVVDGIVGPSGARSLGRFCHSDVALRSAVEEHLRREEALRPDAVFAEIVHLPFGRPGNILARPVLRAYEIPYLGRSGAPADRQITLDDLFLRVDGERIVLFSERLGREVVPRMTTAHRHDTSPLAVYRFFGALQDTRGLRWRWGALAEAPFLPRVARGRVIVSPAQWNLRRTELAPLDDRDAPARRQAMQRLRERLDLPRWVALADDDHLLPIDLDNDVALSSFCSLIRSRERARLVEVLPTPDDLVVEGPEGRYVAELVIPFVRTSAAASPADATRPASPTPTFARPTAPLTSRLFGPGSEWLYAKIYAGKATVDQLVLEVVGPLVAEVEPDAWFFLRYEDPDWHLRLRLRGAPDRLLRNVLPRLHALVLPFLTDGRASRLQLDTYDREVERYGGPDAVEIAERIFEADSVAALAILTQLEGQAESDTRWRIALRGMHLLLTDLGFDRHARSSLVDRIRESFAREHGIDAAKRGQVGARYRAERAEIEALLTVPAGSDHPLDPAFVALAERSRTIAPLTAALVASARSGTLTASLDDIAASLLHMHVNRILRADHRAHEAVLHDFLSRAYATDLARRGRTT